MEIRLARKEDIGGIIGLFDKNYRKDYFMPRGQVERLVVGGQSKGQRPLLVWVAYNENDLVGFVVINHARKMNHLLVHKEYRGQGIGEALTRVANARMVRCKTDSSDGDPTSFFEKMGYKGIGKLEGKKGNIRLMQRIK